MLEGVLASFPELSGRIDVERIAWPQPRRELIAVLGAADHQSAPALVRAEGSSSSHHTGTVNGLGYIDDKDRTLAALSERHGFPESRP